MNKTKKTIVILLSMMCMFAFGSINAYANSGISVYLNETALSFDVQPQIINGRTMVPMRKIFESLGAFVTWDELSQTATAKKDDIIVNISINSKTLFKNGVPKTLDVAPALIEARTLVPVRAIAESFDCNVVWVEETQSVKISTSDNAVLEKTPLSASEISEKVSPSVFYIEVYDENAAPIGSGSGFFISYDGTAVTNYHVIQDSYSAQITTIDGEDYNVSSIIAFDEKLDVAIIKVDKLSVSGNAISGFPSVTMANSDNIKAGQNIFALGSPFGLQNTISSGIISNVKQMVGEDSYIQITAPISHGSSGGALVNEYGEVLGITAAGIDDAQNIGFAIPINTIKIFDTNTDGILYNDFAVNNKSFVLEIYPEVVELEIGESVDIMVYAEGKGEDWSIYWETEENHLVTCQWGDWLEENNSVCPLTITGEKEGVATIIVYSDVDFNGKSITVYVKKPPVDTYPSSCTSVPTYTAITYVYPIDYSQTENGDVYIYNCYDINTFQSYVDYLLQNGFTFYKEDKNSNIISYNYYTPENKIISVALAHRWNQVWIYIPR